MKDIQIKWQALEQSIPNAICLKVQDGLWVTMVYRTWSLEGWGHWMLIPIDKTPATFLKPDGRPMDTRPN